MKESLDKVKESALIFGKHLQLEEETLILIKNIGLHSTVKELVFRSFIKNIHDYFIEDNTVYQAVQILRKYCDEMSSNGEVKFGSDNNDFRIFN